MPYQPDYNGKTDAPRTGEAQYNYQQTGPMYNRSGHPYTGSGNRYEGSFSDTSLNRTFGGDDPFQFPWWAILMGFVTWWPLGFIFIAVNNALKRQNGSAGRSRVYPPPPRRGEPARRATPYAPGQAAPRPQARPAAPAQPQPAAPARPQAAAPQRTEADRYAAEESAIKAKYQKDERKARILLGVGIAVAAIGGIATVATVGELVSWWMAEGRMAAWLLEDLITGLGFLVAGGGMCFGAKKMRVSLRMRRKIANIVGNADHMYIRDIAGAIPCDYEKCCKYLEACIAKGVFGDTAYLDMRTRSLVVRGKAPEQEEQKAEPAPSKEDTGDSRYHAILKELDVLNERIPGEEMSDKIERLQQVSAKIFAQAEANPKKLPQMRKFMDYYLPTSMKLLKTYAELDEQGVAGDNITETKTRIEQAMDTLVMAFEKQLDQLFETDALDVSTDIDVIENMLAADGLTQNADPFDLHKPGK